MTNKFIQSLVSNNGQYIVLPPNPSIIELGIPDLYQNLAAQNYPLGAKFVDGSMVYYIARANAALANSFGSEQPVCSVAKIAASSGDGADSVACGTTPAAGDTTVYVLDTTAAGSRPVNYYEDGYFHAYSSTVNERQSSRINRSTVGNGTGITVTLDHALRSSDNTSSGTLTVTTVDLYPSPFRKTATGAGDSEQTVVGYPQIDATSGYWYWVQTWGPCIGHYVNTWPGETAGQRMVVFDPANQNGLLQWAQATAGNQIAGYLLPWTDAAYGCCHFFLTLRP